LINFLNIKDRIPYLCGLRSFFMRYLLYLFFILRGLAAMAQDLPALSTEAKISILTVGPGFELYSQFGHSAVAVEDPVLGISLAYNYGVFDFRTQGFYLKFLRGQLPYQLGRSSLQANLSGWYQEGRWVKKQVLDLSQQEKQATLAFLEKNYLPQNREYAYKFFFDNCSSRIGDLVQTIKGDSIRWDSTWNADLSFRDWIDIYSKQQENHWSDFGMDLALGTPADQIATAKQAMFLPDNLFSALDKARIYQNGRWVPIIQTESFQPGYPVGNPTPAPIRDSWLLPLLFFGYMVWFSRSTGWVVENILTTIFALATLILFLLWVGTDHGVTGPNAHILWTFPHVWVLNILVKRWNKKIHWVGYVSVIFLVFLWSGQSFHPSFTWLVGIQFFMTYKLWQRFSWI